jgi:hypothetical protein
MRSPALQRDLDQQITQTHRRFVKAMGGRLGVMTFESKERYFAVLSALVVKLEAGEKPLRDVLQEMIAEYAAVILQEMRQGP